MGQVNISSGTTITQNFTIGSTATAALPTGWKADAISTARTLGSYATAATATTQTGGANIATNAASGIYNFGSGANNTGTDRSVGGLSASTSNRSVNVYVDLYNNGSSTINNLVISYNIEKYRTGTNPAGYFYQLYYSNDGTTWNSAGSSFLNSFLADGTTSGYATAPGLSRSQILTNQAQEVQLPFLNAKNATPREKNRSSTTIRVPKAEASFHLLLPTLTI